MYGLFQHYGFSGYSLGIIYTVSYNFLSFIPLVIELLTTANSYVNFKHLNKWMFIALKFMLVYV